MVPAGLQVRTEQGLDPRAQAVPTDRLLCPNTPTTNQALLLLLINNLRNQTPSKIAASPPQTEPLSCIHISIAAAEPDSWEDMLCPKKNI